MIATEMSIFTYLLVNQVSPREGKDNPLQYSCLGNPTNRGAWWATVHEVAMSQTQRSN